MKKILPLIVFSLFFLTCCSDDGKNSYSNDQDPDSSSSNEVPEDIIDSLNGMIFVRGDTLTLGSNDNQFKPSERPAMKVILDYDFYLGIHEFTCGEFQELTKIEDLKDFSSCENDSLPLADVTYYDAALIANAKSKSEKKDTAYTYRSKTYDSENHCINLEVFAFNPEANAYRLPTEAEWVLAASQSWDPKKFSWNADNSDFKSHPICTAGIDSASFCDLAGNLREWVNDWAGQLRDTTVTNYLGAPDGSDIGERILKGGYFSERPSEMNMVVRGDEYTVDAQIRADRIGLRLAFGAIPNPIWLDASGKVKENVVTVLANAATLKLFTGSYNTKLVFRNDVSENLAFVDYNDGSLSVIEIEDTLKVYHPDISPDGKHVAFCTRAEGLSGISTLYVRDLTAKGENLVKLDVKSAAIPRWRVLENGDTVIVYVTDAGNNKEEATFKNTSTWQVPFTNGKFGTPQKLFDGAYHGGISEDNTLAVTGARLLRTRITKNGNSITENGQDTIWYNEEQACNASLVQDGSKRTAFLDFGGDTGRKFAQETYAVHERILILDSTGTLIQTIKSPTGYTFDHTEWATNGKQSNIVATLSNINGAHPKIVLVNPSDSSIIELAEGDELWHPTLWVEKILPPDDSIVEPDTGFQLDPDSAGIYYTVNGSSDAEKYRYKMQLLWQYKDSANIIILGSSRVFRSINPCLFEKSNFALNMANDHNTLIGSSLFFETYILSHVKKLKYLVIGTDIDRLKYLDSFWEDEAFTYPGYLYDRSHNYWVVEYPQKLPLFTNESPIKSKALKDNILTHYGYVSQSNNGWNDSIPSMRGDSTWGSSDMDAFNKNVNLLQKIAQIAEQKKFYVIALETPQNPAYQNTGAYGRNGILRSKVPDMIKAIQDISNDYPHFIFMDENKMGNHDYTSEMAHDDDHLGSVGAEKLSRRLDSLIQFLESK